MDYTLTNKSVVLDSIDYDEESGEYTINFTYYDNPQVREGWVA
jgi:hypothetical protein